MASFKGLFLGVYASNKSIRLLFLPLCYLLLSSPFLLILSRYCRLDSKLLALFGNEWNSVDILIKAFVSLVAFLLPTRIVSAKSFGTGQNERKRRVQLLPYWIPQVRHWGNVVFRGEGWLKSVRESSVSTIFAYNTAGAKHNVILTPSLLDQLLKQSDSLDEAEISKWTISRYAFNMPNITKSRYLEIRPAISKTIENELSKGVKMENLISSSLNILADSLPDLITFNSSIVDQMAWERVAGIELTDGTVEAECDLFALITEFFCNAIISPITGSQFPESYQLLASDLSTFNQFFYPLTLGLPRLFPLPGLPTAMLSRKRLLSNFNRLFNELTNPPAKRVPEDDESMSGEETDADTPTPMTALNELFTKHEMPIPARTAVALQLLHSIYAEVVPLACWTILHIHHSVAVAKKQDTEDTLINEIRKETKIWAEAIQPPSIHPSFPAPPEISFLGVPRAISPTSFPRLRSCINEARRLYKASTLTHKITKPVTLTESEGIRPGAKEQWELDVGSYVDTGLSQNLINTSAANFIQPNEYNPIRFLHTPPPTSVISPSGPHEPLATALLLALVAGVIQLWDITPAPKKSLYDHMQEAQAAARGEELPTPKPGEKKEGVWVVPKAVDGASVKVPKGEVRVRIRRREGLAERRSLRKGR